MYFSGARVLCSTVPCRKNTRPWSVKLNRSAVKWTLSSDRKARLAESRETFARRRQHTGASVIQKMHVFSLVWHGYLSARDCIKSHNVRRTVLRNVYIVVDWTTCTFNEFFKARVVDVAGTLISTTASPQTPSQDTLAQISGIVVIDTDAKKKTNKIIFLPESCLYDLVSLDERHSRATHFVANKLRENIKHRVRLENVVCRSSELFRSKEKSSVDEYYSHESFIFGILLSPTNGA